MISRAILVSTLATPALAECPVSADLTSGIQLTQMDGTIEIHKDRGKGVVEVMSTYPDEFVSRVLLGQGVYVLEIVDIVDGNLDPETRMTFAFPMKATDMPLPVAEEEWTAKTVGRDSAGTFQETVDMRWGAATQIIYGTCRYDMIPGEFSYQGEEYGHTEIIHYVPELGIGVLYSYQDADMGSPDTFPVVEITRVKG